MCSQGKKEENQKNISNATISGASVSTTHRYGAAIKEHMVSYTGQDNATGKTLKKSLKSISETKKASNNEFSSIRQQAGFSAEVKAVAKENAEKAISGSRERKIRTDDMGRVNDQLYDHFLIDEKGKIIGGSGTQMKFEGASASDPLGVDNPKRALTNLTYKKYEKYLLNDVKIEVPSDYYDQMRYEADKKIKELSIELDKKLQNGQTEKAEQINYKIEKLKKIKKNLRKSTVTSEEAINARLHPEASTAKSILETTHRAGLETAKYSATISGGVSAVFNISALISGDEELQEVLLNVAHDTACGTVIGYASGTVGSAMNAVIENSSNAAIRELANTNIAGTMVATGLAVTRTLYRFIDGEINSEECLQELGEQGSGMITAAYGAEVGGTVGFALFSLPGSAIGGAIGGLAGYLSGSALYHSAINALKSERLSAERRDIIERFADRAIEEARQLRHQIEKCAREQYVYREALFEKLLCKIENGISDNCIEDYIQGLNELGTVFGVEMQYQDFDEFDLFMMDENAVLNL